MDKLRERFSKDEFTIFSIRDVKSMLLAKKSSVGYVNTILHNLSKNNEITKITRGIYTFHESVRVVGFAFEPFYYGLEDALEIRGFSGQGSNPIVITKRKVRNGLRTFRGRNYVVHRIDKKHFFGYELIKHGDMWVPVSDIEKTLIDMVYFRHHIPDDVLVFLRVKTRIKVLKEYLHLYDKRLGVKVLGLINKNNRPEQS